MNNKNQNDKCYLIKDGKKCHIPDKECAWAWGVRLWDDITKIFDEELDLVPEGDTLKDEDGQHHKLVTEIINSYVKS